MVTPAILAPRNAVRFNIMEGSQKTPRALPRFTPGAPKASLEDKNRIETYGSVEKLTRAKEDVKWKKETRFIQGQLVSELRFRLVTSSNVINAKQMVYK